LFAAELFAAELFAAELFAAVADGGGGTFIAIPRAVGVVNPQILRSTVLRENRRRPRTANRRRGWRAIRGWNG
jgi:hypothetical protein